MNYYFTYIRPAKIEFEIIPSINGNGRKGNSHVLPVSAKWYSH